VIGVDFGQNSGTVLANPYHVSEPTVGTLCPLYRPVLVSGSKCLKMLEHGYCYATTQPAKKKTVPFQVLVFYAR